MNSSSDTWQGRPKRAARRAVAASIGVGPQAKISICSSAPRSSVPSQASPSSVTNPSKQPGKPLRLASRLGTPSCSSRGMAAITPSGMPGTRMVEGRASKGKGISEPINTNGRQAVPTSLPESGSAGDACIANASARNTIGGMPTPPPISNGRGRCGWGTKPMPIGPSTESRSPVRRRASAASPGPTTL